MINESMINVSISILSALCPLMGQDLDLDIEQNRFFLCTSLADGERDHGKKRGG